MPMGYRKWLLCFQELGGGCVPVLWTQSCAEAAVGGSLALRN